MKLILCTASRWFPTLSRTKGTTDSCNFRRRNQVHGNWSYGGPGYWWLLLVLQGRRDWTGSYKRCWSGEADVVMDFNELLCSQLWAVMALRSSTQRMRRRKSSTLGFWRCWTEPLSCAFRCGRWLFLDTISQSWSWLHSKQWYDGKTCEQTPLILYWGPPRWDRKRCIPSVSTKQMPNRSMFVPDMFF